MFPRDLAAHQKNDHLRSPKLTVALKLAALEIDHANLLFPASFLNLAELADFAIEPSPAPTTISRHYHASSCAATYRRGRHCQAAKPRPQEDEMIEVRGLSKRYGEVTALSEVDFAVTSGDLLPAEISTV